MQILYMHSEVQGHKFIYLVKFALQSVAVGLLYSIAGVKQCPGMPSFCGFAYHQYAVYI